MTFMIVIIHWSWKLIFLNQILIYLSLLPRPEKGEERKHPLLWAFLWTKRSSSATLVCFLPAAAASQRPLATVEVHLSGCQRDSFHGHLASGGCTQDRPHLGTGVKQGHCKGHNYCVLTQKSLSFQFLLQKASPFSSYSCSRLDAYTLGLWDSSVTLLR